MDVIILALPPEESGKAKQAEQTPIIEAIVIVVLTIGIDGLVDRGRNGGRGNWRQGYSSCD